MKKTSSGAAGHATSPVLCPQTRPGTARPDGTALGRDVGLVYRIGLSAGLGVGTRRLCVRAAASSPGVAARCGARGRRPPSASASGLAIGGWHEAIAGGDRRAARRRRRRAGRRAARSGAAARAAERRSSSRSAALVRRRARAASRSSASSRRRRCPRSARGLRRRGGEQYAGLRIACAGLSRPTRKKLILVVIDGLTPAVFEDAVETGSAPDARVPRRSTASTGAPSRRSRRSRPVCLSSIATGAHPDVHHIPHLVWYHRGERRIVEYGSSFGAIRAAGTRRVDPRHDLRHEPRPPLRRTPRRSTRRSRTPGLTAAAVNITCYRGPAPHLPTVPGLAPAPTGRRRFFFYNLFESDRDRRAARRARPLAGSIDEYAAAVGRWLVTRDGFDFLVYYLPDYDFASHAHGPGGRARGSSRAADAASARSSTPPAAATSSSSATRCSSAPTTGRPASTAAGARSRTAASSAWAGERSS